VERKVTPGEIVVMAGGAVCLVFSFLPFYHLDDAEFFQADEDLTLWSEGILPIGTLIVIFAAFAAVLVLLTKFANTSITGLFSFSYLQLLLASTFFSAILVLAFLIRDKDPYDFGFGFFLEFIGAVGAFVGAIIMTTEARRVTPGTGGPTGMPPPPPPPPPPPAAGPPRA
jgi:hypothetical protein